MPPNTPRFAIKMTSAWKRLGGARANDNDFIAEWCGLCYAQQLAVLGLQGSLEESKLQGDDRPAAAAPAQAAGKLIYCHFRKVLYRPAGATASWLRWRARIQEGVGSRLIVEPGPMEGLRFHHRHRPRRLVTGLTRLPLVRELVQLLLQPVQLLVQLLVLLVQQLVQLLLQLLLQLIQLLVQLLVLLAQQLLQLLVLLVLLLRRPRLQQLQRLLQHLKQQRASRSWRRKRSCRNRGQRSSSRRCCTR